MKDIFVIEGKEYFFDRQAFDKRLIIDRDREFSPNVCKIEKEERKAKNDELYVLTYKIYIDDFFIKLNSEKLIKLKILKQI